MQSLKNQQPVLQPEVMSLPMSVQLTLRRQQHLSGLLNKVKVNNGQCNAPTPKKQQKHLTSAYVRT
jgi:hypothetical protein